MNFAFLKFLSKEKKLGLASFIISGAIFLIPASLGLFDCILPKNDVLVAIELIVLFGVIFSTVLYIIKACGRSEKYEDCRKKLHSNRTEDKKKLTDWIKRNSPNFAEEYGKQLELSESNKHDPSFDGIDNARRNITDCFHYIWDCWKVYNLSMPDLKEIVDGDGADLIINKIEPLEKQIGTGYKRDMWIFYKEYLEEELEEYEILNK